MWLVTCAALAALRAGMFCSFSFIKIRGIFVLYGQNARPTSYILLSVSSSRVIAKTSTGASSSLTGRVRSLRWLVTVFCLPVNYEPFPLRTFNVLHLCFLALLQKFKRQFQAEGLTASCPRHILSPRFCNPALGLVLGLTLSTLLICSLSWNKSTPNGHFFLFLNGPKQVLYPPPRVISG